MFTIITIAYDCPIYFITTDETFLVADPNEEIIGSTETLPEAIALAEGMAEIFEEWADEIL